MINTRTTRRNGRAFNATERLEPRRLLATVPTGFVDEAFGTGYGSGTAMAFAPDGRLFALSQGGTVRIINREGTATTTALTLAVHNTGERGLLGIAFDPAFTTNKFVYLYYTEVPVNGQPTRNRVSRFTMSTDGATINAATETLLVRLDTLSSATNHNGGAMNFGPDGKLYVAVGENANGSHAQSLNNRLGKILRYNPDGSIPADNPASIAGIAGTTSGDNRAIWAAGLRNPYTFSFHPTNGQMLINDVGEGTWEEINVGGAGRNYGWPGTEGTFTQSSFPNYTRPLYTYQHGSGNQRGFAITGGAFYSSNASSQFPPAYQNKYFFGDYVNNWIGVLDPNAPPPASSATPFATGTNGVVDIDVGPDGALYYLQRGSTAGVRRILPNPTTAPAITQQPANTSVSAGQNAVFTVQATGQAPLAYQWQRDGVNIAGATAATYTLNNAQAADNNASFRVVITNGVGTRISDSAILTVTAANAAPTPTITLPTDGTLYTAGQAVSFSGSATDPEDGNLDASRLTWLVDFHHDTHDHPFLDAFGNVASGTFTPPNQGETSPNVWYRLYLTATDSGGRSTTVYRDVFPLKATITLAASGVPGTHTFSLDGQPLAAGVGVLGVAGMIRSIEAPATLTVDGQTYVFQSWSDGGARQHAVTFPAADTTYTAVFRDVTAPAPAATPAVFSRERITPDRPPHELLFAFTEGVNAPSSGLTLVNLTTGATVDPSAIQTLAEPGLKRLRFSFGGFPGGILPDGNYRATLSGASVTDSAGNPVPTDITFNFRVLAADANDDGGVNFDDLLLLAKNYGSVVGTFARGNFDYDPDGVVDFDDLLLLAQRYGTTLSVSVPPSPPTVAQAKQRRTRAVDGI